MRAPALRFQMILVLFDVVWYPLIAFCKTNTLRPERTECRAWQRCCQEPAQEGSEGCTVALVIGDSIAVLPKVLRLDSAGRIWLVGFN